MAVQEAPLPIDVTDIQFKAHSKYQLFETNLVPPQSNGLDLLATASAFGVIITGHPLSPELQIIQLSDVVDKKDGSNVPRRQIQLPSTPLMLSLSCDHSLLAVTYTMSGSAFIDIYAVQSFLSNNVRCVLQKVHVSRDVNVKVKQILWNPVIANTVAICLDDGTLGMYVLNENNFEYFSLDKSNEVRCASWSPKGKQIVVAFPNGKLAQYKPDLKLAKTIPIAVQLFPGPFDPIAVQWLSTYQFAVVFLEKRQEAGPMLFIINAPKNAQPTYINYDDICYGQPGPRASQVFLIHILQWNLILMGSANSTELGILGTNEAGETPTWKQYIFLDEARAELPLTADKQDTFPIGVVLETGSTHQLTIGENQIPVMPMVHILSTHGFLLSFNLLNFQPTAVSICSPPQPIADRSGIHLFQELSAEPKTPVFEQQQQQQQRPQLPKPQSLFQASSTNEQQSGNMTFVIPENATSTPAKPPASALQTKSLFAIPETKTTSSGLLGTGTAPPFGNPNTFGAPSFAQTANAAKEPPKSVAVAPTTQRIETAKPFLTVDPNYTPPTPNAAAIKTSGSSSNVPGASSSIENDEILRKMISEEIQAFDTTLRSSLEKSKKINVNVCTKQECSELLKNISDLKDITSQAIKSTDDLNGEIQALRLTLYEAFAMSAEAQSKIDMLNNPSKHRGQEESVTINQAHRRQLSKLQNLLSQNQARIEIVSKQLDAHWSSHLDAVRDNNRARMHIPSLENVYQTMEKQQQILMSERMKINDIKNKIGLQERGETPSKIKYSFDKQESLKTSMLDSVMSMTISDQVTAEHKPLNKQKLERLRATLSKMPIRTVRPVRPDRNGLSSEVVIEKRIAHAKEQKRKEKVIAVKEVQQPVAVKPSTPVVPTIKPFEVTPQPLIQPTMAPPPLLKPAPNTIVAANPSSQPKPLLGQSFVPASNVAISIPPTSQWSVSIKPVPTAATTASPSPLAFGVTKSQSQTSLTFSPATKPITEKAPLLGKYDPTGANKPNFSFSNATKASTEQSDTEKSITLIAGNKENLPSEKPKTSFSFTPASTTTPKSTPSEKPKTVFSFASATPSATGSTTPTPKPLTIFGSAANTMSLFSSSAAPPAAKEVERVSIAAESPSIVKALLSSTPTPSKPPDSSPAPVKPTPSIASPATGFVFSSNGAAKMNDQPKPSTPIAATPINLVKTTPKPTPVIATTVATTAISSPITTFSFATDATSSASPASIFGNSAPAKPSAVPVAATTAADTSSIFKGFGISSTANASPFASSVFGASTAATTTTTPTIVSVQSLATQAKPSIAVTSPTTSFSFASPAASSNASSIFGGFGTPSTATSTITPVPAKTTASSDVGSVFESFSICKPDTANSSGGLFSGNAFNSSSIFSSQTTSAPSIFGSPPAVASTAQAQAASIFGGGATQTAPSAASIFGGNANAAATPSSDNIFGGSTGGSGIFSATSPTGASPPFGSSSPFGQSSQPSSAFGGGVFAQAAASQPVFGGQPAFGSPQNNTGFGSSTFGHGGPSIAQTGFGSPQSASPFGMNAAAAAQPLFGQSATFGSPKSGFGMFSGQSPVMTSTTPQKNSLFESLGSTENAMTFGNLAQAQSSPPAPKPFAGGSSFSSWR